MCKKDSRTVGGSRDLCRSFRPGKTRTRKQCCHVKNHGNVSTKMAAKFRVFRLSSSCFHLILYILVFTRTNSLENSSSLTSNATLGGPNVTNNDTDDNILNESTTQPSDYVTGQPALVSGPLPLAGRLPTPAADGKIIFKRTSMRQNFDFGPTST